MSEKVKIIVPSCFFSVADYLNQSHASVVLYNSGWKRSGTNKDFK